MAPAASNHAPPPFCLPLSALKILTDPHRCSPDGGGGSGGGGGAALRAELAAMLASGASSLPTFAGLVPLVLPPDAGELAGRAGMARWKGALVGCTDLLEERRAECIGLGALRVRRGPAR